MCGYLRIPFGLGGEEERWKVPVGGWRFEMVISLGQGAVSEKAPAYRGKLERNLG